MANLILYTDLVLFFLNYLLFYFLEKKFSKKEWNPKPGFSERWSKSSKPTIGGIGFFFTIISVALFQFVMMHDSPSWFLLVAVLLAFSMGLVDDLKGISPFTKLAGQMCCAAILMLGIPAIPLFEIDWVDRILTLFWIVGVMNSINMLDNMDAVASIPALGILVFFAISAVGLEPSLFPLFLFLAGSVIAFLFFNWPPSKIFMGDSGSMVLGLVLAFGAIQFTWLAGYHHTSLHWYDRVGLTLLIFAVPLADTLTVSINRLWHRISPARGGKDHTTHNFVYSGVPGKFVPVLLSLVMIIQFVVWWWFSTPKHYELMNWDFPPRVGRALASYSVPPGWIGVLFFLCYFILVFTMSRVNLSKGKYSYIK